jgi:hypothetical protein
MIMDIETLVVNLSLAMFQIEYQCYPAGLHFATDKNINDVI